MSSGASASMQGGGGRAPSPASSAATQMHVPMQPAPSAGVVTTAQLPVPMLAHSGGVCSAPLAAAGAQLPHGVQFAPTAVGMFSNHGLPVTMPGPVASASGLMPGIGPGIASMAGVANATDPHLMQLHLQQLALERSAAVRPLRMPYGGGVAYMNGPVLSPHLGSYDGLQGGLQGAPRVDANSLQWSAGNLPSTHTSVGQGAAMQLQMHGVIQPGMAGPGAVIHNGMSRTGAASHALAAAAAGGPRSLWAFPEHMHAALMRPASAGLAYTPVLVGPEDSRRPLPGLCDYAVACGPPSAAYAGGTVPSAFTQVAGFGLCELSSAPPPRQASFGYGCPPAP